MAIVLSLNPSHGWHDIAAFYRDREGRKPTTIRRLSSERGLCASERNEYADGGGSANRRRRRSHGFVVNEDLQAS
jgi:hypothetical protein